MLTNDGFVASNMSGEGSLQRSSWKADAIRRGDLKISGPIPITEETPLSEDEEREFAEAHKAKESPPSNDVLPKSPLPQQAIAEPRVHPNPQPSVHNESLHATISDLGDGHASTLQTHNSNSNELPEQRTTPISGRGTSNAQRQSSVEPTYYSTPSPFPSIPGETSPKMTAAKKKRKSGLRNVFRKMFGRKSRDEHDHIEEEEEDTSRRHTYHRSDPGILTSSPKPQQEKPSTARISDLPVQDLQPVNPLGQHLPFPMNVNAPQESSPTQQYLTFDIPTPDLGRRRATLPSLLLSQSEAHALKAAIGGSVERLPSWDERLDAESLTSPQIGIALSSPPPPAAVPAGPRAPHGAQSVQAKRRSRSAGALRDLAKARPSIERRRSAEIRYWRDSYQTGSIYSTGTRPQTAKTIDTVRTADNQQAITTRSPEPTLQTVAAHQPTVVQQQHAQDLSEIPSPSESFHFGDLKSGFSDDEPDTEEPEIPPRSEKRLSIEDRVKHLEDNMRDLETSVRRISGRSNRQTIVLENVPKGRRSRNRSSSATSRHSSRSNDRAVSGHYDGPPSPTIAPLSAVDEFPSSTSRQTVIVDSGPSWRPSTAQRNDIAEQLAAVQASLKHERSARKTLESQVFTLQRDVANLQAMLHKFMNQSPSYPTPSPDNVVTSNEERLATPRAGPEQGFRLDTAPRSRNHTFTSHHTHSSSEIGNYSLSSSVDDVTSPEAWMTPKEESGFGSGFFHKNKSRSSINVAGPKAVDGEMF
ncbi:hypothetical protein BU24DRAFT_223260 [Aaosphaeria arxii CBS 175.79]|uniref:Uncharacterized protein n=1 Tax=Aaosphaeria arxii CBS 175.79 TaxID=1450172 RepID=A0A6A5XPM3_9PLEO|nr:uncharacterized protein BU24DRAFT_223260 [Aaosphaeria arxii CBS 175.79]KAF2014893.1 hypothetical protein BU24DRAFT_223260 [Aaosphaeria arxii CBS 175.79]